MCFFCFTNNLVWLYSTCLLFFLVLCGKPSSTSETSTRKRRLGDAIDFLVIWIDILEHLVSAATCARVASATVDYTTGGRLREWLFGLESHSLGEPWPDVLGVTITIVITGLFILGLEVSAIQYFKHWYKTKWDLLV